VLISRRRWVQGGTKQHVRGIDEHGNTANTVETEQLLLRETSDSQTKIIDLFSYTQIRGSAPFYWTQEGKQLRIDRSLESSQDGFLKHAEALYKDYECEASKLLVYVNLMSQQNPSEEALT